MSITQMKILVTVVGFVLIFVTGYLLSKAGQPFNAVVLTLHKLISVAVIAYLILTVMRISKIAPLGKIGLTVCIVTGLLFLGAVITGGVLSAVKTMPAVVQTLHKVFSVLTVLSTVVMFLFFRPR